MGGPHDKSDVNTNVGSTQSQQQSQSDIDVERSNIERGDGNGVNEANTGKRRADPAPLHRHHRPPAQQNSASLRRHI